jgi:hypothetical protein
MNRSVILDFDRSVAPLPGAASVDLAAWQDTIRYGCRIAELERLDHALEESAVREARLAWLGSGDFHHVSYLLIRRLRARGRFQVVVFDNHPDNMRYPWGIHCGSWVHHVCAFPFVSQVTVVGITSHDVAPLHLVENHLLPLYRGRLRYLCLRTVPRLVGSLLPAIVDISHDRSRFADAVAERIFAASEDPIYLSIDKDVLTADSVRTNWDQGAIDATDLIDAVRRLRSKVFAADVTGEISFFRYSRWWKRALTRLDGQSREPPAHLGELRAAHRALNEKLVEALSTDR